MKGFKGIKIFIEMLKKYTNKEYNKFPKWTLLSVIIVIIYAICPVDLIPDFIIGFGYVDDASIFILCLKLLSKDVEKYKIWKTENENSIDVDEKNKD